MKAEDLNKVIDIMKTVADNDCDKLDMFMPRVQYLDYPFKHACGTVHCFAGWFFVALSRVEGTKEHKLINQKEDISFTHGKQSLDIILKCHLRNWAEQNPKLWGNEYGEFVFSGEAAFRSETRPNGAENLNDIVDHLTEVYERLKEKENEKRNT